VKARTTLNLKCLTVATVALLAILPVPAGAANTPHRPAQATQESALRSVTGSQHPAPMPVQPTGSAKSYLWAEACIATALLAGFLALGLWGDRVVGGVIFGIQFLCLGVAWLTRNVRTHTSARSRGRLSPNMGGVRATGLGSSRDQ
jgi:hypothetical protein